jgi:lipopolysaccharide/colanic/teichoic acid biosynthesis glycosyltransferase
MIRVFAALALLAVFPILLLVAVAIAIEDGMPVLFRQRRIGKDGISFELLKFRSMRHGMSGPALTQSRDRRITRVGYFIRRYKLDELPQLWNVLRGELSLIGPRAEVPGFVDLSNPLWRSTLSVKPGITGLATLVYRAEEDVLAQVGVPEQYYCAVLLPDKLRLNLAYSHRRNMRTDLMLLGLTVLFSISPRTHNSNRVRQMFLPRS